MSHERTVLDAGASKRKLLFGGPYSNLHALQALQKEAIDLGFEPHEIICTGDAVGYCAFPQETVDLIRSWGIHCIPGNVEEQLSSGAEDCGCDFSDGSRCDVFSRQWYPFAQQAMQPEALMWMKQLPNHIRFELGGQIWIVVHGSYSELSGYVFQSTPWEKKAAEMALAETDCIVAGHSGLPFVSEVDGRTWLNAGVIGMPANDGDPRCWYAILEEKNGVASWSFHRLSYDHEAAATAMREKGLPEAYAKTLNSGIWDNCEILPETETALQGQRLLL